LREVIAERALINGTIFQKEITYIRRRNVPRKVIYAGLNFTMISQLLKLLISKELRNKRFGGNVSLVVGSNLF
jgi:hypothetical protein